MGGFLLKNSAMRRRKAVDSVFEWMENHGLNPEEDCFGSPAASAFVAKLLAQHPKGPYSFVGANQVKLIGPGGFELHIENMKKFLWGEEFKVFNLDAKKDSTQDLETQMGAEAEEQLQAPKEPEPEPEPEPESEPVQGPEEEEVKVTKPIRRKKTTTKKKTSSAKKAEKEDE